MNEALQRTLAQTVYESMLQSLLLPPSEMQIWHNLTEDQQTQFMKSVDTWVRGLSTTEVGAVWLKRSAGSLPAFFWNQISGERQTLFTFAASTAIQELIRIAEKQIERGQND